MYCGTKTAEKNELPDCLFPVYPTFYFNSSLTYVCILKRVFGRKKTINCQPLHGKLTLKDQQCQNQIYLKSN